MLRDTPCLSDLVKEARSRDSGNTILMKSFPGGSIAVAGANAPTGLAGRPRRVVLLDEIDRYPISAGTEGDPCLLAERRTESFWNAVIVKTSTPTIKGISRIESEFLQTDQRKWFCPCPRCGHYQVLTWSQIKWPDHEPEKAYYLCSNPDCAAQLTDTDRVTMIRTGEWRATAPFTGKRGYHLSGLYSPFKHKRGFKNRLHQMVAGFLEAKATGRESMKTWVNTFLAETWEDEAETISSDPLFNRREQYIHPVPAGVLCLTAGVDVQDNRLECELVGWGIGEESWGIEYKVFHGSPAEPTVWNQLNEWLSIRRTHESGASLSVAACAVDSGAHTKRVYDFCRGKEVRRIYAVKGSSSPGMPLISRPRKPTAQITMFNVGTDTAKEIIYGRLKLKDFGPGFMHFTKSRESGYDEEYFRMLVSEKVSMRFRMGQRIKVWEKTRDRNEALDVRVYATAAMAILNPNFAAIAENMFPSAEAEKSTDPTPRRHPTLAELTEPAPPPRPPSDKPAPRPKPVMPRRSRQNFATGWMR